jgi:hypothetical protein
MKTIGYCAYCKNEIFEDEEYLIEGSEIYHPDCLEQKNTYYDSFED